ncbi:MAG: outer membrane beta-barrel protein [Ignavibacteria bacterium]|nr:outer membrane beta-barrel protein [Ignavibacteria bacterium]
MTQLQQFCSRILCVALVSIAFTAYTGFAQDKKPTPPVITFSGYVDTYYAFDNDITALPNQPAGARQFSFLGYVRNQFNLNTAQLTGTVVHDDYRAALTIAYGDLRNSAYVPLTRFNTLQQANGGFRLVDKLWIDGGFFMTHIGGESLLPKDNWFTLYSFATTNEPFYQAGVRLSYEGSLVQAQLHLLNGYGIFEDNNDSKSIGWFLGFTPSSQFTALISGIAGNEQPAGSPAATRIYNDLVLTYQPTDALTIRAEADLGLEEIPTLNRQYGSYLASFIALRYAIISNVFVSGRFEYVANANGSNGDIGIITSALRGTGYSASVEYRPIANSYIRAEVRALQFDNQYTLFTDASNRPTSSRLEGVVSLGVWF